MLNPTLVASEAAGIVRLLEEAAAVLVATQPAEATLRLLLASEIRMMPADLREAAR